MVRKSKKGGKLRNVSRTLRKSRNYPITKSKKSVINPIYKKKEDYCEILKNEISSMLQILFYPDNWNMPLIDLEDSLEMERLIDLIRRYKLACGNYMIRSNQLESDKMNSDMFDKFLDWALFTNGIVRSENEFTIIYIDNKTNNEYYLDIRKLPKIFIELLCAQYQEDIIDLIIKLFTDIIERKTLTRQNLLLLNDIKSLIEINNSNTNCQTFTISRINFSSLLSEDKIKLLEDILLVFDNSYDYFENDPYGTIIYVKSPSIKYYINTDQLIDIIREFDSATRYT